MVSRRARSNARCRRLRVGMTELEVAGILEKALRDEGSEGFPFPSIVASGPRSALPHARSSAVAIEAGDFLLLDFGAETGGYCADVTRTFVMGRAAAGAARDLRHCSHRQRERGAARSGRDDRPGCRRHRSRLH